MLEEVALVAVERLAQAQAVEGIIDDLLQEVAPIRQASVPLILAIQLLAAHASRALIPVSRPQEHQAGGRAMIEGEVHVAMLDYLDAAGGDQLEALRLAVEDLLQVQDEVEITARALDAWTSRGYVRGRATQMLREQRDFVSSSTRPRGGSL